MGPLASDLRLCGSAAASNLSADSYISLDHVCCTEKQVGLVQVVDFYSVMPVSCMYQAGVTALKHQGGLQKEQKASYSDIVI